MGDTPSSMTFWSPYPHGQATPDVLLGKGPTRVALGREGALSGGWYFPPEVSAGPAPSSGA